MGKFQVGVSRKCGADRKVVVFVDAEPRFVPLTGKDDGLHASKPWTPKAGWSGQFATPDSTANQRARFLGSAAGGPALGQHGLEDQWGCRGAANQGTAGPSQLLNWIQRELPGPPLVTQLASQSLIPVLDDKPPIHQLQRDIVLLALEAQADPAGRRLAAHHLGLVEGGAVRVQRQHRLAAVERRQLGP